MSDRDSRDARLVRRAALAALSVHLLVLFGLPLPRAEGQPSPDVATDDAPPTIRDIPLPPPRGTPARHERRPLPEPRPAPPEPAPPRLEPLLEAAPPVQAARVERLDDLPLADPAPLPAAPGPAVHVPLRGGATHPVPIEAARPRPAYPEGARLARRDGQVLLEIVVGPDGTVVDSAVLRVTPAGFGFEAAALEAVRRWRYEPGTLAGRPVAVRITVVVEFTLR